MISEVPLILQTGRLDSSSDFVACGFLDFTSKGPHPSADRGCSPVNDVDYKSINSTGVFQTDRMTSRVVVAEKADVLNLTVPSCLC